MNLPEEDDRWKIKFALFGVLSLALICGVFFLGLILVDRNKLIQSYLSSQDKGEYEIFGFAPYWTLSKTNDVNWDLLTTFAYFSLPVNADGTIQKSSYEWRVFKGEKLKSLFEKAKDHKVKRVITLTQMEKSTVEAFLSNPSAWEKAANESIDVIRNYDLDGVNIDFEYIPSNQHFRRQFSKFVDVYTRLLKEDLKDPYVTVSVLASSVRFNKIYDIGHISKVTDGVFMMAYDFYYPGSATIGPVAPLGGFNEGKGPFWYDVSTAVADFLNVADSKKIILGVPYYGWNYPAYIPKPKTKRVLGQQSRATTQEKAKKNRLLSTTPTGGWDSQAKVSWRGYWDKNGWNVVYLEDKKSLSLKYDLVKEKKLGGVGIWALGYDLGDSSFWATLRDKFKTKTLATKGNRPWNLF